MVSIFIGKVRLIFTRYPVTRGMVVYSILWPVSNLCQQKMGGREKLDFTQAARYGVFGGLWMSPVIYTFVKMSGAILPGRTLKVAVIKAIVEQLTSGPIIVCSFFFGMSILEGKTVDDSITEVKIKFLPTFKMGCCVWPLVQIANHAWIPERNKVPFVGAWSFLWTIFLSYMKQLEVNKAEQLQEM